MSLEGLSADEVNGLAMVGAKAAADPKLRKKFMELVKAVNPDAPVPELELDSRLDEVREAANKRVAEMEAKLAEKEAREKWAELRAAPVKKGLVSESEMEDLEKYMKDNGFNATQYEQAARLRKLEQNIAEPTPSAFGAQKVLPTDADLRKDPRGFAQRTAHAMIADFKRQSFR